MCLRRHRQAIIQQLNAEIAKAPRSKDAIERLAGWAASRSPSPEQFASLVRDDLPRWAKIVRTLARPWIDRRQPQRNGKDVGRRGALGLRVVEMGQLIAGPFAAKTLGDFGADVIKIEAPGSGDPLRNWRKDSRQHLGMVAKCSRATSARLPLTRDEGGQALARQLIAQADVLDDGISAPARWRLGHGLRHAGEGQPSLIMRISGYGQTGPYRDLPGFGAIGVDMGGLRPHRRDRARAGALVAFIGDNVAALHGTIGVLTALISPQGQWQPGAR